VDALIDAPSAIGPARALVIPMCNEVARIERSLATIAASPLNAGDLELVLVDDGSIDRTATVAAEAAHRLGLQVRVLELGTNQGKGAAVRAGMLAATARTRVFVDADLSVEIKDLLRCFETLEGGVDVAYGTRAHPESTIPRGQPAHRVLSGRTYNLLLRRLGLTDEHDTQCGMKGFTAAAAEAVFSPLSTNGFGFDVEALARAQRGGWRVAPVPVTWSHVEASRVRALRDGASMGVSALGIRRRLAREEATAVLPAGAMAPSAIEAMGRVEREHWWFRAKRALVADAAAARGTAGAWIDVGCGTGALVEEQGRARPAFGVELDPGALARAAENIDGHRLARGTAEAVPIRSGAAAVVTALDVVEHLDDDVAALRELGRVARGGLVVVAVPAYTWAWSDHDVRLGHRRRYTRRSLREAAVAADLEVIRVTHFHSWLVPPALLLRRTPLRRIVRGAAEEASFVSPAVNRLLVAVTTAERRVLRRVDLPVGLSILLVAAPHSSEAPR
jgi:SAM-dependent methyltransferase